jgi:hypothetical protein
MTKLCDHNKDEWCIHCEEGCQDCGQLEDINDNGYCDECSFDRLCMAADAMYDRMKEGD